MKVVQEDPKPRAVIIKLEAHEAAMLRLLMMRTSATLIHRVLRGANQALLNEGSSEWYGYPSDEIKQMEALGVFDKLYEALEIMELPSTPYENENNPDDE